MSPCLQAAWADDAEVYVHGLIYGLSNGLLTRLVQPSLYRPAPCTLALRMSLLCACRVACAYWS